MQYFYGVFGLQNNKYWIKQYKIEQHNTRQNSFSKKTQGRTVQNKFLWHWIIFCFIRFLEDGMLFWYFRQLVHVLENSYKSNTWQLELLCHVLHLLANQMHP